MEACYSFHQEGSVPKVRTPCPKFVILELCTFVAAVGMLQEKSLLESWNNFKINSSVLGSTKNNEGENEDKYHLFWNFLMELIT